MVINIDRRDHGPHVAEEVVIPRFEACLSKDMSDQRIANEAGDSPVCLP